MLKEFLVEIRVKAWVVLANNLSRTITYEQVLAEDEYHAKHCAYEQFVRRTQYEPMMRLKWYSYKITLAEVCAPDAVEI